MKNYLLIIICLLNMDLKAQSPQAGEKEKTNYTILLQFKALPGWLALTRDKRNEIAESQFLPLVAKYHESVSVRLFDSEAFHQRISDFMIIETNDLLQYYFFMESFRDTDFYSKPYFEIQEVVMGIEGGYRQFEQKEN